ncbi:hypothetical protein DFJ58DRAFT_845001 [Suillus subalutaceus]|uniref:uncharacterized protein n=1 Tax=Suillus subalutaceus TaxID=48586 RepID=UPI001B887388|nr:uncharacterized protein DFJ58DRAFT_845001 [Suillus subalutaceus]KAG1841420.1 hypothetical protein DFJ58DRAFT_845001 [Suillus subalutaceus]
MILNYFLGLISPINIQFYRSRRIAVCRAIAGSRIPNFTKKTRDNPEGTTDDVYLVFWVILHWPISQNRTRPTAGVMLKAIHNGRSSLDLTTPPYFPCTSVRRPVTFARRELFEMLVHGLSIPNTIIVRHILKKSILHSIAWARIVKHRRSNASSLEANDQASTTADGTPFIKQTGTITQRIPAALSTEMRLAGIGLERLFLWSSSGSRIWFGMINGTIPITRHAKCEWGDAREPEMITQETRNGCITYDRNQSGSDISFCKEEDLDSLEMTSDAISEQTFKNPFTWFSGDGFWERRYGNSHLDEVPHPESVSGAGVDKDEQGFETPFGELIRVPMYGNTMTVPFTNLTEASGMK